jgi:exodeoxyribonuclease VII large subunit
MQNYSEKKRIYTVSQFNKSVRGLLEASYPIVWIEGEISNLVRPASGHCYFSLKDESAQIRCALFKNRLKNIGTALENGKKIVAMAHVSLYEGRGDFQIIIESVEDAGEGLLRKRFEQLKNKLLAEGLFDDANKNEFPLFPKRIGVITSPTGAVIHDILTALNRRFPAIPITVYPTLVQGENAARSIANVIHIADKRNECSTLILARGGGSLEDLWPFNEEVVARAIHDCKIPIISGVGHETDTTIADWVADKRAPTPTAAAELISPDQAEVLNLLSHYESKMSRHATFILQNLSQKIDFLTKQIKTPDHHIQNIRLRIQSLGERLSSAALFEINKNSSAVILLANNLAAQAPANKILINNEILKNLSDRLVSLYNETIIRLKNKLHTLTRELNAISPLETMARGYSITRNLDSGEIVRDSKDVRKNDLIETILKKTKIISRIEKISKT